MDPFLAVIVPLKPTNGASGVLISGQEVTLNGTGFGTKSRAVPAYLRDKCTAPTGTIDPQWTTAAQRTNAGADAQYNIQLQDSGFRSITPPHPGVSRFYAGGCKHGPTDNYGAYNVFINAQLPYLARPCTFYAHGYYRWDPNVQFPNPWTVNSTNNKWFCYSGDEPNLSLQNVYFCYNPAEGPQNSTDPYYQMVVNSNYAAGGTIPGTPPNTAGQIYGRRGLNAFNPANGWLRLEVEACWSEDQGTTSPGYVKLWCNGGADVFEGDYNSGDGTGLLINYLCGNGQVAGGTDTFQATDKRWWSSGLCIYYADHYTFPFSYQADLYVDMSAPGVTKRCARVMAGDANTWAASKVRVPQDLVAWSDSQIKCNFWPGPLANGSQCWFHVITETGKFIDAVATGTVVTVPPGYGR